MSNVISLLFGFIIALGSAVVYIPLLKHLKFGQFIREEGLATHYKKEGTPTIGGLIFITAMLLGAVVNGVINHAVLAVITTSMGFAVIGFIDDYIKVIKKHNLGLSARAKLTGQLIVAGLSFFFFFADHISHFYFNWFSIGGPLWAVFFIFLAVAISNAVNLTDGVDGLAAAVTLLIALFFSYCAYSQGQYQLTQFNLITAGSLAGYLIYNWHPAQVMMGDIGSLALGGYVLANAVLLGIEWYLPIFGFVYFFETLSVMIQVSYFKMTGGKRIFRMTPFHHHLEMVGWSETRIVYFAVGMTLLLSSLTLLLVR